MQLIANMREALSTNALRVIIRGIRLGQVSAADLDCEANRFWFIVNAGYRAAIATGATIGAGIGAASFLALGAAISFAVFYPLGLLLLGLLIKMGV